MAWEQIHKSGVGGTNAYRGKEWATRPCVSIGKTVITFNKSFAELYAKDKLRGLFVLYDESRRAIGFKVPTADQIEDPRSGWYAVGRGGKNSRDSVYLSGCKRVLSKIVDCVGKTYRATMNPEERIIEVILSPNNEAR